MPAVQILEDLIGQTPMLPLKRLTSSHHATVWVKMEAFNPGGSVKDRIALSMIENAEKKGLLQPGWTIIEPTSGNTGIALAMLAVRRQYHCVLAMPETMSVERRNLLQLYGAEIILTPGSEGMGGAIARANELVETTANAFQPEQFNNLANPDIHRRTTGPEIWEATGGKVDAFVCGVGTGGTITGVAEYIKPLKPNFQSIAVEPEESPVLSGGQKGPHKIQGIGAGFIPSIMRMDLLDSVETISSQEAIHTRERLISEEGLMCGISSGASVAAALRVAQRLGPGHQVVTMLHDTGERYLSMS